MKKLWHNCRDWIYFSIFIVFIAGLVGIAFFLKSYRWGC